MRRIFCSVFFFIFCLIVPDAGTYAQTTERAHGRGIEFFPYPFTQMFYFQPRFDRVNYDDGTYFNSYILRGFSTYWNRMHFRVEVPLANTNTSGENVFGLSDINVRVVRAHPLHKRLYFGYGLQLVMNTATDESLGGGKWDLRPGIGAIFFRGTPEDVNGTVMLSFEYRMTLAKEYGRTPANVLATAPNVDWWFKKWYIGYYATWTYDFETEIFDLPVDVEAGYFITPNLVASVEFIQPIIDKVAYKNELAVKLRYSFLPCKR